MVKYPNLDGRQRKIVRRITIGRSVDKSQPRLLGNLVRTQLRFVPIIKELKFRKGGLNTACWEKAVDDEIL